MAPTVRQECDICPPHSTLNTFGVIRGGQFGQLRESVMIIRVTWVTHVIGGHELQSLALTAEPSGLLSVMRQVRKETYKAFFPPPSSPKLGPYGDVIVIVTPLRSNDQDRVMSELQNGPP